MTTQTQTANKQDLSHINNLKDLHKEIVRVKAIVKLQENELKERAKRFPQEAAIASVNKVVHFISKKGVPLNIINLVRNGIGLMMNIKKQRKGIQGIFSQVKELILFTVLGKLVRAYQQKKQDKQHSPEQGA